MKLFTKLALAVSILLIGTTLGLTSAFYWIERSSLRAQAVQERQVILNQFAQIVREGFLANDDLLVVKYVGWLLQWNPSVISAGVIGSSGETLAHSEPDRMGKPWQEGPITTEALAQRETVLVGNHPIATASVTFSQRYYDDLIRERLHRLLKRILLVASGCLSLGLLFCFLLAISWTRPIHALVKAAGDIGRGQYNVDLTSTDRRQDELGFLSRAFLAMAEQLRQLEIMKEDFVSAVTHELRSPLGAIESYLNLIQEELKDGISEEAWKEYLDRLRTNTTRLSRFVNDLLDVAAIERGKIELQLQAVNVGSVAQDVLHFFAAKTTEKNLTTVLNVPADSPLALADADKIRQVLTNLLSNAIKFTPAGGRISITVRPLAGTNQLEVAVLDTGLGIATKDQARIFNKFEQVTGARSQVKGPKGTGLGLSISQSLVEMHGGRLRVESRPGHGSCFAFTLPIASVASPGGALR